MADEFFNSVTIIGVGLIGGSLSIALKEQRLANRVIGFGRDENRLKEALKLGIIDSYTLSLKETTNSELIVLATPMGVFEKILMPIVSFLREGTIVIDVGSVKKQVVESLEKILPPHAHFIGTHPIAGSDRKGFEYAKGDLFRSAKVILTPTERTDKPSLDKIAKMWEKLGAVVEIMSADTHDKIYALMSHLPHLVSFSLVNTIDKIDKNLINYAGSGFKDTTRIARSDPTIWKDIFCMNRHYLLGALKEYIKILESFKNMLEDGSSEESIFEFIERAKRLRESID